MTKTRDLSDFLIEGGADLPLGKPHIVPGVLQPAVAGNDLSGTALGNSYVYGTAHTDGHKYYYTDIKGSKPIKDPRIGAHFGSQRHKFKSIQILEQETATHGKNVYSLDGREWVRAVSGTSDWRMAYDNWGHFPKNDSDCAGAIIEIVGYFNDINFLNSTYSDRPNDVDLYVNGTILVDGSTTVGGATTTNSPLGGRYVDASSAINGGSLTANGAGQSGTLASNLGTTPKINTLKFEVKTGSSKYVRLYGIELIAQDTTSTANRSKIQIPSQDVVSFGKKFTVSATATHYDPFNGFTNDSTLFSSVVDTATSLGLGTGTTYGAPWDKGSDDHIRPFNGGRVVKWVDSSGTIKTSVTMIPANAQNIGTTASNEITTASATNSHTINFSDDAIDHSLAEVAKTFHYREFGIGSANGNTTYLDVSTISSTAAALAFVMDDGLTSFSGEDVNVSGYDYAVGSATGTPSGDYFYITFIGTGLTLSLPSSNATEIGTQYTIAQNLPYGTHVYKQERSGSNAIHTLDGVVVATAAPNGAKYITIHQPKKPPIPEDCVVLADYMLMADFVGQATTGTQYISKGTRISSCTRDMLVGGSGGASTLTMRVHAGGNTGFNHNGGTSTTWRVPAFCTNFALRGYDTDTRSNIYLDTTNKDSVATHKSGGNYGSASYLSSGNELTLGLNKIGHNCVSSDGNWSAYDIATPIHTSHHYQPFETTFLHELIGGDRNMEQTNLVCSPDGKTWDQLTRDTSYIGKNVVSINRTNDTGSASSNAWIFDDCRGVFEGKVFYNKDWAISYDKMICLKTGQYQIDFAHHVSTTHTAIEINGTTTHRLHSFTGNASSSVTFSYNFKRGDYLRLLGGYSHPTPGVDVIYQNFQINRI
tara:strand:- start:430 stop:3051 length:2622 start_codon:yes stop_codon:yes gene_type:complete